MAWTTPILIEVCIGLEINGYLPAEFCLPLRLVAAFLTPAGEDRLPAPDCALARRHLSAII